MRLATYLTEQRLSYAEFARRIEAGGARVVERYAKGQRIPNRKYMIAIVRETEGLVGPDDFLQIGE